MYRPVRTSRILAIAALGGALIPLTPAFAADYQVSIPNDVVDGVCTFGPTGGCSLREAILAVNAGADTTNTITLAAGTYTLAIGGAGEDAGATGDLDITNNVTITGAGEGVTIINGANIDRVVHVLSANDLDTVTVSMSGITIQNGTVDAASGGCVYIDSFGTVELANVTVTNCTTTNAGRISGEGVGGAIYNSGTLTMLTGTISDSIANVNQPQGQAVFGGGGLYNAADATATLRGTTVRGNLVTNAATTFATGGGILNLGTLTIRENNLGVGSTIGGDDRATDANVAYSGGGISNIGGFLAITNSTIKNNETLATADVTANAGHTGGGIYNINAGSNRGNAIISASTIDSNYSDRQAGGLFSAGVPLAVSHTTISNNHSRFIGGGMVNQGDTPAEITNSTIAFNICRDDVGNSADTRGGGIFSTGRITMTSATVAGNFAAEGQQIYVQNNTTSGAVAPQLTVTNAIVAHDSTVLGAGLESTADNNCAQGDLQSDDSVSAIPPPTTDAQFAASYIVSRDFNLDSGSTCAFAGPDSFSDLVATDPIFLPGGLQALGGPTAVLPIDDASPARDRRALDGCPSRDQRYYVRSNLCDNGAYETDAVAGAQNLADIKLTITESAEPVFVGDGVQLVYTLTITNISRDDAVGVMLEEGTLSGQGSLVQVRVVVGSGSCTTAGSTFGCNLGTLAGLSTTKVSVTVSPTQTGEISVSASVYPTDRASDPFLGNNTDSETTTVAEGTGQPPVQGDFGSGGGALHWASLLILLLPALRRRGSA